MERRKGIGFWVGILLCLVVAVVLSDGLLLERAGGYTYPEFIQDINEKSKDIERVVIIPNSEVPTGAVEVEWKDGSKERCYVSDINEVRDMLVDQNMMNWMVTDAQRESWLDKNGGELVLAAVIFVVFLVFVNSQQSGANSKMANFGKSRARMLDPSSKATTFKQGAGLEEEK